LLRVQEQRNILHEIRKRKANWTGHILRRNCLLQRVIEGKIQGGIEVTGRRGRRCRKLLDDLKERIGYSHLKEEALDRSMWRSRFGRGFGPVVRQTTKWMNPTECITVLIYHLFLECFLYCVIRAAEHYFRDIFRERDGDYILRLKGWSIHLRNMEETAYYYYACYCFHRNVVSDFTNTDGSCCLRYCVT